MLRQLAARTLRASGPSALALCMLFSADALAYCRKRSVPRAVRKAHAKEIVKRPQGGVCEDDQIPEFKSYPWVSWPSTCTSFSVSDSLPTALGKGLASKMVADAFSPWSSARCDGVQGDARPSIDLRDFGDVSCTKTGYDPNGGPNQNLVVLRQNWDELVPQTATRSDADLLGLTTVTYDDSGHILDADMQINMQVGPAINDPVAKQDFDLQSVLTHELGHFIGILHSEDANATMYFSADRGETNKRYLNEDDRAAVCAAYPPNATRTFDDEQYTQALACNPIPQGGFSTQCSEPANGGGVCAIHPASSHSIAAFLGSLAALNIAQFRRKKRRATSL